MFKGVITLLIISNIVIPNKSPKINPSIMIVIPSKIIILNTLFLVYPSALRVAKSPILFSRLAAKPANMLKAAIRIKIIDRIAKLFEPIPNIEVSRVISTAGLAA